jgi:predicted RNase H-like nuclease
VKTAGIDGCKAGWILITFDEGEEKYEVLRDKEVLKDAFETFDRIFIDMPIGLEDEDYTRKADELLRKKVGGEYASSVFSPPIRPALMAPSYVEANMISHEYTEKKLTLQSWNITPKIQMVDELLRADERLRDKVLESHPELLFQTINGGMIYQKKNLKKGIKHRLKLIEDREPIADDFFRDIKEDFRRNEVEEDDIVDAMVLAYSAKISEEKGIKTIPEEFEYDSEGMRKAIHYV